MPARAGKPEPETAQNALRVAASRDRPQGGTEAVGPRRRAEAKRARRLLVAVGALAVLPLGGCEAFGIYFMTYPARHLQEEMNSGRFNEKYGLEVVPVQERRVYRRPGQYLTTKLRYKEKLRNKEE